jgi:hypothetical protein
MNTTFATQMRLDDDAVGKALSQIGDPAIPVVESLVQNDDTASLMRFTNLVA